MTFSEVDPILLPSVYWFWHSIPTDEEIEKQISEMDRSGIRTFLIQARLAFPRADYLSESYFTAYKKAVIIAKAHGMTVGIYDDYNWDSGHAGGRTVELDDTAREVHLFWTTGSVQEGLVNCTISNIHSSMYTGMGEPVLRWIYENGQPRWDHWLVFKALAFPNKIQSLSGNEITDVTDLCSIEPDGDISCRIKLDLRDRPEMEGDQVVVFAHAQCVTSRLINYLSPQAVDAFLKAGYEPYRKHLSRFFGDPIRYVFFDHPYGGFYDWQERFGNLGNSLLFDPGLPVSFATQKGYSLEKALLAFIRDFGQQTPKFRCDFFEIYGTLGRKNFFGKLAEWTKSNGLGLSGHELLAHVGAWGYTQGFTFLDPRTNFGCDYFDIDSYRTQTAVDASNYVPQISAKIGDSVAKANGRRGCLIEQYAVSTEPDVPGGAGYWGLTLAELRAQAIRHMFLGASQFIFHGYYQTDGSSENTAIYENPRFDFAPGLNFEPWFKQFPVFAREMAQLNSLINASHSKAKVAVLYPMLTWWVEGSDHAFSTDSEKWFQFLVENNIPFDLINEAQLRSAQFEGGSLQIGEESFRVLVLPAVTTLGSDEIVTSIEKFVLDGGMFIASTELPTATQREGRSQSIARRIFQLCVQNDHAIYLPEFSATDVLKILKKNRFCSNFSLASAKKDTLRIWAGEYQGDPIHILFNDQEEEDRLIFSSPDAARKPFLYDLNSNEIKPWPWMQETSSGLQFFKDIQAGDICVILFQKSDESRSYLESCTGQVKSISAQPGKSTDICLEIGRQNVFEVKVRSPKQPTISGLDQKNVSITHGGKDTWIIRGEGVSVPEKIELTEWTFSTEDDKIEKSIDIRSGWENQGFGNYKGVGVYRCHFNLEKKEGFSYTLNFPRISTTAEVCLNGSILGILCWGAYMIEIPFDRLVSTENELIVNVANSAANYYYDGTPYQPSGKIPSGLIGLPAIQISLNFNILLEG